MVKKNDVAKRGEKCWVIFMSNGRERGQSEGLGFQRTVGDSSVIAGRKPAGGIQMRIDRCGEWAVWGLSLRMTSISTVTSERREGVLEVWGERNGYEITGWSTGGETSLGKYAMLAKGMKSPLEVCGREFKMKPGSVMPDAFGWAGARAERAACWNCHQGCGLAQGILGSKGASCWGCVQGRGYSAWAWDANRHGGERGHGGTGDMVLGPTQICFRKTRIWILRQHRYTPLCIYGLIPCSQKILKI